MSFAEPRPHRRPFHAHTLSGPLTVSPRFTGGNLALTSFTVGSQDGTRWVRLVSTKDDTEEILLEVYVPGSQTLHFPFPHPIMVGAGRTLSISPMDNTGAFLPMTVVGYEWNEKDLIIFFYRIREAIRILVRRKDP
ncbi:MAG TPA: hypothetical protein VHQ93_19840 [Chitinophagaceae bacterium]|jgi:hypothetical protein|nr:hypothetical protein [Chitinophagaceae bacterium]